MSEGTMGFPTGAETETTAGKLFKIIRNRGPITASEIVRITGLSKSTVSVNLEKILEAGFVVQEAVKGSKKNRLRISQQLGFVVGIEFDQSSVLVGLCDLNAALLDSRRRSIDLVHDTPEAALTVAAELIDELVAADSRDRRKLIGMGVGVPGPVDFARGIPITPPVMPGWDHFPVATFLSERFGCPVFVDNDVNVMALAERERGMAQSADDFLFVKIGVGVGCGIIVDGELFRGSRGAAGDIGHIGIDGNETPCLCGNSGCLEVVAGARALVDQAVRAGASGESPFLANQQSAGAPVDLKAIGLGVLSGDRFCTQLIMESGHNIGLVLAKIVNFFNPSMIVIGGNLAALGERYIASIREAIYRRSTPLATADLVVKKSLLGEECGVIGAAVLALDEILSHHNLFGSFGGTLYGKKP